MPWRAATSGLPATHSGGCGFWPAWAPRSGTASRRTRRRSRDRASSSSCCNCSSASRYAPAWWARHAEALELHARRAHRCRTRRVRPRPGRGWRSARQRGREGRTLAAGRRSVADPDVLGAAAAASQPHFGRRRQAVVLQEMVFDRPHMLEPEAVGELPMLQRLTEHPGLVALSPRGGQLQLVENSELHDPTEARRWDDCSTWSSPPIAAGASEASARRCVGRTRGDRRLPDVVAVADDVRRRRRARRRGAVAVHGATAAAVLGAVRNRPRAGRAVTPADGACCTGDITGRARIDITGCGERSEIRLVSSLTPTRRSMALLTALAGPIARRSHDWVLDTGARQFAAHSVAR